MADKKISELTSIVGADTAADDFFVVVDTSGSVTKKISRAELNNAIEQDVLAQVDITSANIDGGTIDNTPIGSTTASTGNFTTVDTTGNVTVGGNLTVNGTTTTVNSTTLDVDDINITVASGAASAAAADGAGLTVDGASATFNYASTGDKWTMNKPLDVSGTVTMTGATTTGDINFGDNDKAVFGAGSDLRIYHDGGTSIIADAGTGNLQLRANDFQLTNAAATQNIIRGYDSTGAVGLHYGGAEKLATTSGGIDVTGTVTADGLTVDGAVLLAGRGTSYNLSTPDYRIYNTSGNSLVLDDYSNTRLSIASGGDISFYDSTGVTQGFFWDASTQRLGLGTTSPLETLTVYRSADTTVARLKSALGASYLRFENSTSNAGYVGYNSQALEFWSNNILAQTIDSSGNVGIGTSSPAATSSTYKNLQVALGGVVSGRTDDTPLYLSSNVSYNSGWKYILNTTASQIALGTNIQFFNAPSGTAGTAATLTERMRIDSSGALIVGDTAPPSGAGGVVQFFLKQSASSNGIASIANASDAYVRITHDGSVGRLSTTYGTSAGYTPLVFDTGGAERMRIDSSGNVGIGTSSPSTKLDVEDASTYAARIGSSSYYWELGSVSASSPRLNAVGTGASATFFINGTEAMRIDSSGNLLVGDTSVASGSNSTCTISTGGTISTSRAATNTQSHHVFYNPNGNVGTITTNGTSTAYNTSSDYRLKENVVADWDATTRLKQLNPVRFNFIADADTTVDGFLAHEVQDIVPEAITGTKDAVDADGNPVYQGIDQSKLVPLLVKTIQELEARIAALEAK